jgi:glycosyltransferase involved in cell wall biosynthesis
MSPIGLLRNPKLTVGVPAYRNAKTIRATVDSILAQSYGDIKIVISDDVSPDDTAEVGQAIAATDSRITFVQQPKNLNYGNFRYLVKSADTEYFMWLAGDDTIGPDFVKENLKILEAREDVVLSVSRCLFLRGGEEVMISEGTYPLMGSTQENLLRFIYRPADNGRMYGIFRTSVLRESFPERDFHGYDFACTIGSLLHGKHYELPEIMMYRDYTPRENYVRFMYRDGKSVLGRLFPLLGLTRHVLAQPGVPRNWKTAVSLASINLNHHLAFCRAYHPRYAKLLPPLIDLWERHISWRANPWQPHEIAEAVRQTELSAHMKSRTSKSDR